MKFRKRILLIYISIITVFLVSAISISGSYLLNIRIRQIEAEQKRSIHLLEKTITAFLQEVAYDLQTISQNPAVQYPDASRFTSFIGIDEESFQYSYSPEELTIIEVFNRYRENHPHVNSVYMGRSNGSFVRSHPRSRNTPYDPRVRPWYKAGESAPDRVVRTDAYPSVTSTDLNIGTVKGMVKNNEVYGVIGIDVTLQNLNDFLDEIYLGNEYESEIIIFDGNSNIIASKEDRFLNNDFGNIFPDIYNSIEAGNTDAIYTSETEESSYYFIRSEFLNWYIGVITPLNEIRNLTRTGIFKIMIWELLTIMLMGFIIAFLSDTYLIKRIQKLHDDVIAMGSTSPVIKTGSKKNEDEITLLRNSFYLLFRNWKESVRILKENQSGTIYCLGNLAETRDPETSSHILRTQQYVRLVAEYLSHKPEYRNVLDNEMVETLFLVAPLHDIGKVGIQDRILLKPGKLTDEEFSEMKKHTVLGYNALSNVVTENRKNNFFSIAAELALTHHERWDGTGYPSGLAGKAIPLSGRIMALADIYDALTSDRVYKEAFTHEKTRQIILQEKERQLDPEIVDAFLALEGEFQKIHKTYKE